MRGSSQSPEKLTGQIRRVVYRNDESGYLVAALEPEGGGETVALVGVLPGVAAGETLTCNGRWETSPQHGRQFRVTDYQLVRPSGSETIRRYLGSGLISGIGPKTAKALVDHFGEETLDVIEHKPARLRQVPGIGRVKAKAIVAAWEKSRDLREVGLLLEKAGAPRALVSRVVRVFGDQAAKVVRVTPYRLVKEVRGVGFLTADRIARRLGRPEDDPARLQAGLLHVLEQATADGNTVALREELIQKAAKLLGVPGDELEQPAERLVAMGDVQPEMWDGQEALAPKGLAIAETRLAGAILGIKNGQSRFRRIDEKKAIAWVHERIRLKLTTRQAEAVLAAVREPLTIITGGPGTGKTTIVRSICEITEAMDRTVSLCAPTGRAAKRLAEVSGREAKTVHRLLEAQPGRKGFERRASNPLSGDLVICDEASMLDVPLAMHLTEAVAPGAHLVLVGDMDQLPSVGPGNVLADLIASQVPCTVQLDKVFRQAAESRIIINAHRIKAGEMPNMSKGPQADFFLLEEDDPEKLRDLVVDLAARRLPKAYGLDPMEQIMVLSPMHKGEMGVAKLNWALRERLNPKGPALTVGERFYRVGDKVMQTANDYDREIYNGDLGRVARLEADGSGLVVDFDGRLVSVRGNELDDLVSAYAVSIHKSQGCEYPCVVVPLHTQHYILLARNLLYTAVTRGKQLVVLCGSRRALRRAVSNDQALRRKTLLTHRLEQEKPSRLL